MDIKKEIVTVNETVMRSNEKVLITSDIIVPDVKNDIAKILRIDADAIVESCVYTGGHLEIDGKIYLTVIYIPDGDEKVACSISTDIPFETQIEDSNLTDGIKAVCGADVYNIEFNLLNSRKISVKTLVNLTLRAVLPKEEELVVQINEQNFETMPDSAQIFSLADMKNVKFTLSETLDFPSAKPSAVSILKTDARLTDCQTHLITGKIVIKGNVSTCLLYLSDENKIEFINHEIPFTEVIDAANVNENTNCDLNLEVCVSNACLKADSDADMRLLSIELLFSAKIFASEDTNINLISDCFSNSDSAVCERKKINLEKVVYRGECENNIKDVVEISDKNPPIETVYNLMVKPYVEEVLPSNGQATVRGSCDCYVLYIASKESAPVCSVMKTIAFETVVHSDKISENTILLTDATLKSASYNITVSGEIEIRACVNISVCAINSYSKEFVTNIKNSDNVDNKRRGINIYFPKKDDTLWEIAKKYKAPTEEIISLNKIENPNDIKPGKPILIPMPNR